MIRTCCSAGLALVLGCVALVAQATPIAIYNTGSNGSGGLAVAGNADPHWQLTGSPGAGTTAYVVSSQPGTWAANAGSQWIAPGANGNSNQPVGSYTYQTSFDLTGFNFDSASLVGSFAVDNCETQILLNGVAKGPTNACAYESFTPFSIASGFVAGVNTLTFVVYNQPNGGGNNPSGLNVLVSGTVFVPEPGSLALVGLGLIGLIGLGIRRRWS